MTVTVLRDHVGAHRVIAWAAEYGWPCVADIVRSHHVRATVCWLAPDSTKITYIEDHTSDVRFVEFSGRQQYALQDNLQLQLPCYREDEILINAESSPDPRERIRALDRLAACRPAEVHHRYLAAWARALADSSIAVRRAALRTAHGCTWPELEYLVRQRIPLEDRLKPQLQKLLEAMAPAGERAETH